MSTTRHSGVPGGVDDPFAGSADATRRGAHRARPTPLMAALPAVAVVVVVVLVAVGVYTLLGGAGNSGDSGAPLLDVTPTVTSSVKASPSASASEAPAEETTTEATEEPQPDKSVQIMVLNNTAQSGLAKSGRQKLQADGWTVKGVGDHKPRGSVLTTTVYYSTEDQKATAEAISAVIGAGGVEQNAELAGSGITVVLSTDYTR
jgi:hypothetical protein